MNKSNVIIAFCILLALLVVAGMKIVDLEQRVSNMNSALELIVSIDEKQTKALEHFGELNQEIVGILHEHDAFIEQQQWVQYEQ